mmetsp:Transcript_15704/g.39506  ORF Transcript_15704/g.39506 Transcript_15704/m.39506 type:complete len:589 (-) Transcript_15704:45-1811(-)
MQTLLRKHSSIATLWVLLLLSIGVPVSSETIRRRSNDVNDSKPYSNGNANANDNGNDNDGDRNHESCLDQCSHPDRMTSFPGWNQPLPSAWYSGYLDYELEGQMVHTHYILVQAEDQEGTDEDLPLIYWTNGGPGASSLFGLLTEIGPLMLSDDSLATEEYKETGIPTPMYNPYTWTRLGSILIIDQPAPVGFSYCNNNDGIQNVTTHSCGGITWTDELSSLNSYKALQTFFQTKFPCLANKELYLTGESYGGIYVPTLARRIVEGNADANANANNTVLDLKGFAVGDGCLGTQTSMCGGLGSSAGFVDYWHLWFMAGHHQMPLDDFRKVMKACSHSNHKGFLTSGSRDDDLCKAAVAMAKKEVGGFFEYALYDECTYRNGLKWKQRLGLETLHGALNDYPCGAGPVLEEYMALGDVVKDAFHVKSAFFEVDNAEGDFEYIPTEPDLEPFYKAMNDKLKILVYNGDTDPAITSFATQNWTSHLGFEELAKDKHGINGSWRPWTSDGCQKMGGYVQRYEGGFDFLTIRGAGHMVPTYKPEASFAFLKAWLQDDGDYPVFDANCTQPPTRFESRGKSTNMVEVDVLLEQQ